MPQTFTQAGCQSWHDTTNSHNCTKTEKNECARHSEPCSMPHCRVLPPGEFNSMMPVPISVNPESFIKPGTHWRQSWIQHGRLCWKSIVDRVSLALATNDRIGDKFDRIGNEVQPRQTVEFKLLPICCQNRQQSWPYRQQSTLLPVSAMVDFQQSRPCWMQLCRRCVPGFTTAETVSFYCCNVNIVTNITWLQQAINNNTRYEAIHNFNNIDTNVTAVNNFVS